MGRPFGIAVLTRSIQIEWLSMWILKGNIYNSAIHNVNVDLRNMIFEIHLQTNVQRKQYCSSHFNILRTNVFKKFINYNISDYINNRVLLYIKRRNYTIQ